MSSNIDKPVFVNIGGINFQHDAIKSNPVKEGPTYKPFIQMVSDNKSQQMYTVELKDGTKMTFPEQSQENNAGVTVSCKNGNYAQPNNIIFTNINGAQIVDTERNDNYELRNCNGVNINAQRETVTDHGYVSITGIAYINQYTCSADNDKIKVFGGNDNNVQYTSGCDTFEQHQNKF